MFHWVPYAMVRIAMFFIAGILIAVYNPDLISDRSAIVIFGILIVAYAMLFLLVPRTMQDPWIGILGLSAVLFGGYLHLNLFIEWDKPGHLSQVEGSVKSYAAVVTKLPEDKGKSWKYNIKITGVYDGDNWTRANARALLYIRKQPNQPIYFYGDEILVHGHPQLLNPPRNPHEFDFKRFLSFKNIYHQQFAQSDQVQLISPIQQKDFRYYSFVAREWAANKLKTQLSNPKEQAIALALTLGVTDGIDNELQSAYAASGAMHVLAVSGLHVGILYGIVLLLFKPFRNLSWSRWLIAGISLMVLWAFAFITGLSPSVLRAVTMFSFMAIAKPFGRSTSIYNTLASSAFLLLLYDPYLIMSVGFQLSYLAVLGIVTIHRPLYQWWEPKSAFLDWVWNISCVSIAAQLATFSLGLLYFHQFPLYFLFSNLFVIPGAISVLVLSIAVVVFSFVGPVSSMLGILLKWLIQLLNLGVYTFEKLPFSLIDNIYLTTLQCWLLMLALGCVTMSFYWRRMSYLMAAFVLVISFSFTQWHHYNTEVLVDRLIVYDVPGHLAVEFISNGQSKFFSDSVLINDRERMRFHIRPNRLFRDVKNIDNLEVSNMKDNVLVVSERGKKIGLIIGPVKSWPDSLELNYLIVGNDSFRSLAEINNKIKFDELILASDYNRYLVSKITNADKSIHSVSREGAFEVKI